MIDEADRVEREKQAAIEREEYAKQQAEQARLAEVKRQKDEADAIAAQKAKLEADEKHTDMVRCEIKEHIMNSCNVDNELAVNIVKALLKTDRVTINY